MLKTARGQWTLIITLVVLIGLGQYWSNRGVASSTEASTELNAEFKSPDNLFELGKLETIHGKKIRLNELDGLVLVNIWATWCPPCIQEIPSIISVYEEYKDQGFTVIGISIDYDDDELLDFVVKRDIPYPIVKADDEINEYLKQLTGVPASFFYKDGELVQADIGYQSKSYFVDIIKAQLN